MKNSEEWFNNRFEQEERISSHEDRTTYITQFEKQKEKKNKQNMTST